MRKVALVLAVMILVMVVAFADAAIATKETATVPSTAITAIDTFVVDADTAVLVITVINNVNDMAFAEMNRANGAVVHALQTSDLTGFSDNRLAVANNDTSTSLAANSNGKYNAADTRGVMFIEAQPAITASITMTAVNQSVIRANAATGRANGGYAALAAEIVSIRA